MLEKDIFTSIENRSIIKDQNVFENLVARRIFIVTGS
jgi:hypothetical protein